MIFPKIVPGISRDSIYLVPTVHRLFGMRLGTLSTNNVWRRVVEKKGGPREGVGVEELQNTFGGDQCGDYLLNPL